jgi:dimethylargininase
VPDSFPSGLSSLHPAPIIDVARARAQHDEYHSALEAGGFATMTLPADESHPDSVFVEDTVIVVGDRALITRPGHPDRIGEIDAVADVLDGMLDVQRMSAPATLDGGDVLQVGRTVYVGRSSRTNAAGIAALARFVSPMGRRVVPVEVRGVLHLKSAATAVDSHTVVVWPSGVDVAAFDGLRILSVAGDDPEAANVLPFPEDRDKSTPNPFPDPP